MKLFINSGICERKCYGNAQIEELEDSKLKLTIPNYLIKKRKNEFFTFELPGITEENLDRDCMLRNITLKKTGRRTYKVSYQDEVVDKGEEITPDSSMYALLRNSASVKDDIFIPASMKDKVKVLERIRFIDDEVDYGAFLSNVYLIEITIENGECLPVYLAYENPNLLDKHYVFSRIPWWDEDYHVSKVLETYIILNEQNRDDYISLASLCEEKTN